MKTENEVEDNMKNKRILLSIIIILLSIIIFSIYYMYNTGYIGYYFRQANGSLGFSVDGEYLYASFRGECLIWKTDNFNQKYDLFDDSCEYSTISNNGEYLQIFNYTRPSKTYNLKNKTLVRGDYCVPNPFIQGLNISFSPDGRYILNGRDIYDIIGNIVLPEITFNSIDKDSYYHFLSLKTSVDNCWLVIPHNNDVYLFDHITNQPVKKINIPDIPGITREKYLVISMDGTKKEKEIYLKPYISGGTKVFNFEKEMVFVADFSTMSTKTLKMDFYVNYGNHFDCNVSEDGKLIGYFGNYNATVYCADTGAKTGMVYKCQRNESIYALALNNKKNLLAIASYINTNFNYTDHLVIKIFDMKSGKNIRKIKLNKYLITKRFGFQ